MKNKKPEPITKKEEVASNPDPKIDQDFKGFPHSPSSEKMIHPITKTEKKVADTDNMDGEKRNYKK